MRGQVGQMALYSVRGRTGGLGLDEAQAGRAELDGGVRTGGEWGWTGGGNEVGLGGNGVGLGRNGVGLRGTGSD